MREKPRIAVILDENTSGDASRYEASKGYFQSISDAGGVPMGIPYLPEMIDIVINEFDGLLCSGGRYAFPDDWYLHGETSKAPSSERLTIEHAILCGYLQRNKPVLGICAGMQMLACIYGARLWPDVQAGAQTATQHDAIDASHLVTIAPHSQLFEIVGRRSITVNSSHREAIRQVSSGVIVSARAMDGVIEAIEIPSQSFAIGLQWHQERFAATDHPANAVFRSLIDACRAPASKSAALAN